MDCIIKKNYEPVSPVEKTLTVNYTGVENNRCRFAITEGRGTSFDFIYLDYNEVVALVDCLNKYIAACE